MSTLKTLRPVEHCQEHQCCHRSDSRNALESLRSGRCIGTLLDRLVQLANLLVKRSQHIHKRRELPAQLRLQCQCRESSRIVFRCPRSYLIPTPKQQRSDLIGELGPRLDQSLPYIKLHPDLSLLIAQPVRQLVGPELARLNQTPRIPLVCLELLTASRIHRRKVRIGDDDFHSHRFKMSRHPLTGRTGFQQDFGPLVDEYGILEMFPARRHPCLPVRREHKFGIAFCARQCR